MVCYIVIMGLQFFAYFKILFVTVEFEPSENSTDDEATIGKEDDDPSEQADEVKLLQQESGQTIDDLLTNLPPEYLASLRAQAGVADQSVNEPMQPDAVHAKPSDDAATTTTRTSKVNCSAGSQDMPSTTRSGRKRRFSSTHSIPDTVQDAPSSSDNNLINSNKIISNQLESSSVNKTATNSSNNSNRSLLSTPKIDTNEGSNASSSVEGEAMEVDDSEFVCGEEEDDEDTMAEQEQHEGDKLDHQQEIQELQVRH